MPNEKRVNPQNDTRNEDIEGGVTVMSDLLGGKLPEIEVDRVQTTNVKKGVQMVIIRVNQDVEDMSYVAGGRTERYTFQTGNRYRVPVYIARELEALGKIWH